MDVNEFEVGCALARIKAHLAKETMHPLVAKALEEIDASFFSGDQFHNQVDLDKVEFYVARWQREIANIKEMLKERDDE